MNDLVDRAAWGDDLRRLQEQMQRLQAQPALGARSLGVPEWDWALWRIGRGWLAAHAGARRTSVTTDLTAAAHTRDVYLATEVYEFGGHTALIGDFVRALDGPSEHGVAQGESSHLILTDVYGQTSSSVPDVLQSRVALPAARITVLAGPSLVDRLDQLFRRLLELRPERLFLFHHPQDPLGSAVAHVEVAPRRVLVHHADSIPSFGMYLPGVQIVDLNPSAAAMSRLIGRIPALLRLTAPDPGPRPVGFLTRGRMVTATSGSPHKYASPYLFGYPETVRLILQTTGGWHVHIGSLHEPMRAQIAGALHDAEVPPERFVYVPWTPSVASSLWEHGCDLYLASFPIDGARTKVDVMASATPYLRHSTSPDADPTRAAPSGDEDLVWRSWEDLAAILDRMANPAALEKESTRMRAAYERTHHPKVFARDLSRILNGAAAGDEDVPGEAVDRTVRSMVRSLTAAMLHVEVQPTDPAIAHVMERLESQQQRIEVLEGERHRIEQERASSEEERARLEHERLRLARQVDELGAEAERWRAGRGPKARLRQWLMRP